LNELKRERMSPSRSTSEKAVPPHLHLPSRMTTDNFPPIFHTSAHPNSVKQVGTKSNAIPLPSKPTNPPGITLPPPPNTTTSSIPTGTQFLQQHHILPRPALAADIKPHIPSVGPASFELKSHLQHLEGKLRSAKTERGIFTEKIRTLTMSNREVEH